MAKADKQITLYWGKKEGHNFCFFIKHRLVSNPIPCRQKDLEKKIMSVVNLVDNRT